jgi:hypothetical protein
MCHRGMVLNYAQGQLLSPPPPPRLPQTLQLQCVSDCSSDLECDRCALAAIALRQHHPDQEVAVLTRSAAIQLQ